MSVALTWPAAFPVRSFGLRMDGNNRRFVSPYSRKTQVVDLIGEKWVAAMTLPVNTFALAQQLEAFFAQLRGMDGTVDLWHLARPAPTGTMRGSPVLSAGAAQGAQSLAITTIAGATVRAGDMLGLASQLLMVATDATANGSGAITVALASRLRAAVSGGAAVVWDKPTARFRAASDSAVGVVTYGKAIAEQLQVEFLEE